MLNLIHSSAHFQLLFTSNLQPSSMTFLRHIKITTPCPTAALRTSISPASPTQLQKLEPPQASTSSRPLRSAALARISSPRAPSITRSFTSTRALNMASDEDYSAFLDKANQDTGAGNQASSKSSAPAKFKATDSGSNVPKPIRDVCSTEVYVSDADEPFEEVSLKWDGEGGLPDEGMSTWSRDSGRYKFDGYVYCVLV